MPKYRNEDKLHIFEMFKKGLKVKDISKTSNIPFKTLYRWWNEWTSGNRESSTNGDIEPLKSKIEAIQRASAVETETELEKIDWVDFANKQSLEACISNGLIRKSLSELLLEEINKQDKNYRALSILSGCINIHSKLEREYGLYDVVLNPDKAINALTSMGYSVTEE